MDQIKFLLKFGERKYLERLQCGNLYFSNALKFRYYEEKLLIKGQGDRLEGGSMIHTNDFSLIDNSSDELVLSGVKSKMLIHYEPANMLPVYCLFACFGKDCHRDSGGNLHIHLGEDIKNDIISHFPKADTVAVISNPEKFIENVNESIGYENKSGLVNYFNLLGYDGKSNDLEYFKYLTQDIAPVKEDGKTTYTFNDKYVYRSLLCKDIFFNKEQEYRFILPSNKISDPREFKVKLSEEIQLEDIEMFFNRKV